MARQRKQIFLQFHQAYNVADLQNMLYLQLGRRLEDIVSPALSLLEILGSLIANAERNGWLLELLQAAAEYKDENEELGRFVRETIAALAPADLVKEDPDPFNAFFLRKGGRAPFLDRENVREGVRVLAEQDGAYRVLMVDGPRYSGRTYTLEFISYLSSRLESFKFYYTDLKEDYTPDYRPGDLLVSIAHRMGADPRSIPAQEAQSARWTRLLYDWLIEQAARSEQSWWIVVDGAGQVSLTTEMQDFLHRLVKEVDRTNPPVRIVLLDCGDLCREWTDIADNILPADTSLLTPAEVKRFFRSLAQLHGTDVAGDGLEAIAEWVVQQASEAQPPPGGAGARFMRQLATAVGLAYQQFFTGSPSPANQPNQPSTTPSAPAAPQPGAPLSAPGAGGTP